MSRLVALLTAVALSALLPACGPAPVIVSPGHETAVDPSGDVPVEIDLGVPLPPEGRIRVALLAGIDAPPVAVTDLTPRFDLGGAVLQTTLSAADLREGRNTLYVSVDREDDGVVEYTRSATFSYEPDLDLANADRCDVLDPAHCLLPFPNDFFTVDDPATDTGRRVNLSPESMPANNVGVRVDPTEWNRNDGWSPGPMLILQVPGVDLELSGAPPITDLPSSLEPDSPVVLIDVDTLERQLAWAELDSGAPSPQLQTLTIRPARNLREGATYAVGLRHLVDGAGEPIEPTRAFVVLRDGIPTYRAEIESRREHMEDVFDALRAAGIAREELQIAWDFTVISTRNMSERLLHMRDDAFASLAGEAPVFDVTTVDEAPSAQLFRRVRGTYQVPLYMTNDGRPNGHLTREDPQDPDSLPVQVGEYTANFDCIIPNAAVVEEGEALTADPVRASLYGHGLLGSASEANAGHNRDFADEHGFLSCATDWIGMSSGDIGHLLNRVIPDFSFFPTLPDRLQQGYLNTLFLGRLLVHEDGFASHCAFQAVAWSPTEEEQCPESGDPLFSTSDLFYDGNSQGAIAGGGVTAFAQDWTRAVLGVPGMNYSTLLRRSVDFAPFGLALNVTYPNRIDQQLGVAAAQMLWDRGEANGHANHLTTDPYPNTPPHQILLHVAFGDHQVANVTAEIEARTIGARVHQPALAEGRHSDGENAYFGIPAIPAYPWDGSALVVWDSGTPTPPVENVPPMAGTDPHETPRRDAAAKLQKSEFLRTDGAVIDVCDAMPCTAVDP